MALRILALAVIAAIIFAFAKVLSTPAVEDQTAIVVEPGDPKYFDLYFFGGQSNMAGFGDNKNLPAEYERTAENVYLFHGAMGSDGGEIAGQGQWSPLTPGFGAGFEFKNGENKYSERFGPELTFGHHMTSLQPERNIAIIKYVRGATALQGGAAPGGTWNPDSNYENGINQYDHFLATVENALTARDIDGDGVDDIIVPKAIVWFQGEGDASHNLATAMGYEPKLKRLMDLMRAAFRVDDLPVVICQISDSGMDEDGKVMNFVDEIRAAQERYVETDTSASLVRTDGYGFLSDKWHFDSEATMEIGKQIAEKIYVAVPQE